MHEIRSLTTNDATVRLIATGPYSKPPCYRVELWLRHPIFNTAYQWTGAEFWSLSAAVAGFERGCQSWVHDGEYKAVVDRMNDRYFHLTDDSQHP